MIVKKALMAFLAPLTFFACTDINDVTPHAPSGETNDLSSSSEDTTISSSSEQIDGTEMIYRGVTIYAAPHEEGIWIRELDPVTFDTLKANPHGWTLRGVSSYLDSAVIDSLPLKNPYVMLSTAFWGGNSIRRFNIVDIRESNTFAVDKKTYFESIRALYLMKSGKPFAEAKKQASKEVLESFGSYADAFDKPEAENVQNIDYRNYMVFIEDFMKYTTEDTVVAKLEKCGNITCGTEFLKKRFLTESLDMLNDINDIMTRDMEASKLDVSLEALNNRTKALRDISFLKPFVANLLDADSCSAEKEGTAFEILDKNIILTCRSGEWEFSYKEIKHSMGTMTDERDGKTYKTVTYDIEGKSQTWMAERLTYSDSEQQDYCEEEWPSHCNMYYVNEALSLDSSMLESKSSCIQRFMEECPECDSSLFESDCEYLYETLDTLKYHQHLDSVMTENGVYQGICPDGWHIPTQSEVDALLNYMVEWYYPAPSKTIEDHERRSLVWNFLHISSLGNPSGFGLTSEDNSFFAINNDNRACHAWHPDYCNIEYPFIDTQYVRCVKN
ncbi:MAG: hypothetical protein IK012_04270 [Fibrobacter sp.]|uniref:FISUMP domain-containing protein n=1 Tax=Fibrobacter sp. TaxID=35828 RepID=UPI0025B801AE|nr:FISUMP domain-containing protein [Fibrobacter sp.]MBR4784454.1 hypothetical protein [Fibrobacter sp.]